MSEYYLKPNIKAEPLIWGWYAWSHLISPLTAGCNIVERHIKIMQSYVQNPQIHAQAIKDPKMLGGPFIDYEGQYVDEIRELMNKTKTDCKTLIELNNAFKEFDRIIQSQANGGSVEELYNSIPALLKGFIEIVYDLNNHPSIRLIEPLLYKAYYTNVFQEIAISSVHTDFRKFVLSTPRIEQEDEVYIKTYFSNPKLDLLFSSRDNPCNLDETVALF